MTLQMSKYEEELSSYKDNQTMLMTQPPEGTSPADMRLISSLES